MSVEHLRENAMKSFEEAQKYAESKPDASERMQANGHQLMAAYYLANSDPAFVSEVSKLIDMELGRFSRHPDQAYTYRQNQYALLCLSAKDKLRAKHVLSLPAAYKDSGAFDVQLNIRLRRLLEAPDSNTQKTSKLTKLESDLIEAFDAALNNGEIKWQAVAAAWKSLRSKRYKLTVLEHRDLFTDALQVFQG